MSFLPLPPEKLKALHYYSRKFQTIRVDRVHGVAPHKPILLLAIIEMIGNQEIHKNEVYLTQFLNQRFLKYWSYLGSEFHNPDISRPYFHMRSGKFWHLMPNPGHEKVISSKVKLKTLAEVKRAINFAYLDEDLFDFLCSKETRNSLLSVLVGWWFPGRLDEIIAISKTQEFRKPMIALEKIKASLQLKGII